MLEYDKLREALKGAVAARNSQESVRICNQLIALASIIAIDPQQIAKVKFTKFSFKTIV
jgi:hypothetical protein